ncbi:MAG: questin oxidase family protein [Dehalococcoidia bacterium]
MTDLDQALSMMGDCGPEFGGNGLSNHGPMAAEALTALGRGEDVEDWVARYRKRLDERPARVERIGEDDWRSALGDLARVSDWEDFFAARVDSAPWREVLEEWVPILSVGIMAGATHGLIRTAHAVRSLVADESSEIRRREFISGLAYWAARYQSMPGTLRPIAPRMPSEALADLQIMPPRMRERRPTSIFVAVAELDHFAPFEEAINLAAPGDDVSAFLSDLTSNMARLYLQNAGPASIPYVHTVTAPSALRMLAPHLSLETAKLAARYAWLAAAAIHARGHFPHDVEMPETPPDREDLIDRAVFSGDEHAIKFTEACLREYTLNPEPAFLAGPLDMSNRYGRKRREGDGTNG